MTTITYHSTADGRQVADSEALDERGVLRDGITMRTSVALMDGDAPALTADEQRNARIDAYDERVSNAWRSPAPQLGDEARRRDEALAGIGDVYERYDRRIQDAWR